MEARRGLQSRRESLQRAIAQAAHKLPSQGPIKVFVHHNTLHAFEHLPFDVAVQAGSQAYGCQAYLSEERYREKLARGRIRVDDLEAVLHEDLGDEADRLLAVFCTRYALRLSMLQHALHTGASHLLRWVVAETDALRCFRKEAPKRVRADMLLDTQQAVLGNRERSEQGGVLESVLEQFEASSPRKWKESTWESLVLNYLWRVCCKGVRQARRHGDSTSIKETLLRPRDYLLAVGGPDADQPVHDTLIRFCAAYLDQGFADWDLPQREADFFDAFLRHYAEGVAPTRWSRALRQECRRVRASQQGSLESIEESLACLGIAAPEQECFITQSLLALRGWSGMVWQMESNAEWAPRPAPNGSLQGFLATRLLLDRIALQQAAEEALGYQGPLAELRDVRRLPDGHSEDHHLDLQAFIVFQLAQLHGWRPRDLESLAPQQWTVLVEEIAAFSEVERRRMYHRAFERKYRNETFDAVLAHHRRECQPPEKSPAFQVVCCLDDREESFRRHLEEIQPASETFGIAGFFGVAMYYRGASDAHFTPLCPVTVKPRHYVVETPVYSAMEVERKRAEARRRIGQMTHQAHLGSRTFLGGLLTGLFGSLAAIPLVARILLPRTTSRIRRVCGSIVRTSSTELQLERICEPSSGEQECVGYSLTEMADIVEGSLRALGLAQPQRLSRLVVICGHGSSSLNNPHGAAYDCGACGGGRGGPNARAFAQMANDPRVRSMLRQRGVEIPASTLFVGAYHNTCDDNVLWYDLDRVPVTHRQAFEEAKEGIDAARQRSAQERCRRFESAELTMDAAEALRHVEGRAEDLSQTRPECGHATNALCLVGRREWSRGLFLDRRAFLTSYDPAQDDSHSSVLEATLQAVIPVCAGINLEYYFSYVDSMGYGCGTKLPHNITSLLGVMDGAASDLRPGLPWQMVEIHEPMRLLFLIETTRQAMRRIIDSHPAIARLVKGGWVQLAVFEVQDATIYRYVDGAFVAHVPHNASLPTVGSSRDWYRGQRGHLGFASIDPCKGQRGGVAE